MRVVNSLKGKQDKDSKLVKRRGRLFLINKKDPRKKSRQG